MYRIASGSELKRDRTFINPFNGEPTNPPTKHTGQSIKVENRTDTETEEKGEGQTEQEATE